MNSSVKIKPLIKLKKAVRRLKKEKKRIVFTNGCFDIVHPGHIKLLERAKSNGDILIVALNSDASVKKIKGPSRPLVPGRDRARVIAALECVDFVVFFNETTPLQTIRALCPDVLVKGGDWKQKDIVGRDDVKKVVRVMPLKGRSTTALINEICKRKARTRKRTQKDFSCR